MAVIDFPALSQPVADDAPCGPDLEVAGDPDYMNFMARIEGLLPESYLSFDRATLDVPAELATIGGLLARSRDLRLLTVAAKLLILDRDLSGFAAAFAAVAALLHERWDDVHPRGEEGDYTLRMVAVQSLDENATIAMPLQAVPLVESRRFGKISFRSHLVAAGEVAPREGEAAVDATAVAGALDEAEIADLVAVRDRVRGVQAAAAQIAGDFISPPGGEPGSGHAYAVRFERLAPLAARIVALLDGAIVKRDPTAVPAAPAPAASTAAPAAAAAPTSGRIRSLADARQALAAASAYFAAAEPSSPAALLVHQAERCIGRSFLEVMQILVPGAAERTTIPVGGDKVFDLTFEQLRQLDGNAGMDGAGTGAGDGAPVAAAASRPEALALLEEVAAFYRAAEPSSPIPLLVARARDFAESDFMSILQHVLPGDALRKITP
ncbi:MAG TPA: type VI secretion system ImpA family N-terminal domain-containing protein [Hyphomicrobiales bacterium]|nr:type VI secretion system ImpA family N-terminal domain-containing protein [Hyphomicrobiales bacterium]